MISISCTAPSERMSYVKCDQMNQSVNHTVVKWLSIPNSSYFITFWECQRISRRCNIAEVIDSISSLLTWQRKALVTRTPLSSLIASHWLILHCVNSVDQCRFRLLHFTFSVNIKLFNFYVSNWLTLWLAVTSDCEIFSEL